MKNFLLVALAVTAGFVLGTACGPPVSKCATTCLGCCDTSGVCQAGSSFNACGQGGSTCRSCSSTETCSLNVCSSSGLGGGAGGGSGGGTGGGSLGGGTGGGSTGGSSGGGGTGGGGSGGGTGGGSTGGGTGGGSNGGGTGGGSTGGGTGGGTTGGGTGGAGGGTGGGSTGTPPNVNVTLGNCGMVTPCAGNLVGTWFYTTACNDDPLADFRQYCPTLSTTTNNTTLSGRIDFGTTSVTRTVTTNYSSVVNVPASCNTLGCSTIQSLFPVGSTCVASGGGCNCTISGNSTFNETGTWTTNNGVITVVTPNTTRTFNSCVAVSTSTTMLLRENGAAVPATELGTTLLTKQ